MNDSNSVCYCAKAIANNDMSIYYFIVLSWILVTLIKINNGKQLIDNLERLKKLNHG